MFGDWCRGVVVHVFDAKCVWSEEAREAENIADWH
jgi:hypothetical protein